jgi:hypothetical protein
MVLGLSETTNEVILSRTINHAVVVEMNVRVTLCIRIPSVIK